MKPYRRIRAGVVAALLLALPLPASARTSRRGAEPRARETAAAARPDAALYQEARAAEATLRATAARQAKRTEWEKVVVKYRRVVARYPQSAYCDNALLAVGDLYRDMGRRFRSPQLQQDAIDAYRALVAEYPSSSLGEKALYSAFEIARGRGDTRRVAEIGRLYVEAFPAGGHVAAVRKAMGARGERVPAANRTPSEAAALARVFNLRFWSGESSTRVVIDLERQVPLHHERLVRPDRLFVDLSGTRLHPNLLDRTFPVGDGLLEQIRIAQNRDDVVRVVLDFRSVGGHSVFYLQDPARLVIDVRGAAAPAVADRYVPEPLDLPPAAASAGRPRPAVSASPASPAPGPARVPGRAMADLRGPSSPEPRQSPSPAPIALPAETRTAEAGADGRLSAWTRHDPSPSPTPAASPAAGRILARIPARDSAQAPQPAPTLAPLPPRANRAGSYSLARQLGLGARRIVIDAGHGGHDPGSIGRGGLQEKALVLDVALRLEKMLRDELGAEVVMTRSTDVFIPLEERTAIANSRGADLFLSIHANSSRNPKARGVETYFLNFAQDPHAEEVAARENAISAATMKDLGNLVKAITLNAKIDESRDFAASVQEAMIGQIRHVAPEVQDRGVRTAPFYVLIGANMPSVLAEVSFVSNPTDEKLLKQEDHRDRIARSLLEGVRGYLQSLDRNRMRQLTGPARRNTVAAGSSR